ncbi:MAG: nickel-dependent lactate racemase [Candidatus Bathyarchaeia archaeon]|nr:nickel-dependent lactate racemase [Candidatus Bathyarchaeota archaeon]
MIVNIPYGKTIINLEIPNGNLLAVLQSAEFDKSSDEVKIVWEALKKPIRGRQLTQVASGKKSVCVIVSDYTRATPNRILLPPILKILKDAGLKLDEIKILIAYGLHKPIPKDSIEEFLGREITEEIEILNHNAEDDLFYIGKTSFGTKFSVNRLIINSDLVILTGLIEPHFFAGYSGGRKAILPGVSSKESIFNNHSFRMIMHPLSRYGILDGNPIHEDMVEAVKMVPKPMYLINVVINKKQKIAGAFTGDIFEAHLEGIKFLDKHVKVRAPSKADIVITSNGGYPLDRDLYQAVKGMATGELIVKKGGVIVIFAECIDGIGMGHEDFYQIMAEAEKPEDVFERIMREEPIRDQWEAQILARILKNASVILVTKNIKHSVIEEMHMIPASNPEEAIEEAYRISGKNSKIIAIPEGPYVIPKIEA